MAEGTRQALETRIARVHHILVNGGTVATERMVELLADMHAYLGVVEKAHEDTARLDWLADPANKVANVLLPTVCVEANLHSLRAALDAARFGHPDAAR